MNNNNHQSANIISSNSFNSNTFSSNNKKSRSKKHSEDYSIKSEIRGIPNDFKDIQTFPAHFLPLSNRMSSSSKIDSSNQTSQKQLTKKILERIESEQNKLKFLDEDKSFENDEEDRNKSLTEIEEDILHTISNRHSSSGRINNCESKSDSMQEESLHSNNRDSIKKKVTFIQKITRAKTYDINLKGSKKKIDSSKNSFDGSLNNSSNVNINSDKKKKTTAYGPERIYDILKNKQEEKGANKIFKNIAVMMLVNHFVRQIKLRSGNFGILGNRQLKILNDLCNPYILDKFSKNQEEHTNILVRMIRKNQLNQKISRRPNFLIRWGSIKKNFEFSFIYFL